MAEKFTFPKRFLWGVATAAHQVEGNNHNNWTVWELEHAKTLANAAQYKLGHLASWPEIKKQAKDPNNYVSGMANDHYTRYEEDFDLMKKMHLNAFRFSIEWSRIEPEEGVWDAKAIAHYRDYIAALKKRGIEPLVTLYHWTVPVWFSDKGAFEKSGNIEYFVRFAEKVLQELGKDLQYITTINEPDTVAALGYWLQEHPPYKRNGLMALWVYRNHLKAHKKIFTMARKTSRRFKVGFVKGYAHVKPADERFMSRFMTRLDPMLRDGLVVRYVGRKTDFLGVNYYFTDYYSGIKLVVGQNSHFTDDRLDTKVKSDAEKVSDLGWGIEPENLEHILVRLKKYKKPIFVMETGLADKNDVYRKDWLNATIRSSHNALKAGVDVRGYLHWTFLDNFEWAFGRWPRFGLVEVDYENGLKRIPRKSALYYATFVKKMRGTK